MYRSASRCSPIHSNPSLLMTTWFHRGLKISRYCVCVCRCVRVSVVLCICVCAAVSVLDQSANLDVSSNSATCVVSFFYGFCVSVSVTVNTCDRTEYLLSKDMRFLLKCSRSPKVLSVPFISIRRFLGSFMLVEDLRPNFSLKAPSQVLQKELPLLPVPGSSILWCRIGVTCTHAGPMA